MLYTEVCFAVKTYDTAASYVDFYCYHVAKLLFQTHIPYNQYHSQSAKNLLLIMLAFMSSDQQSYTAAKMWGGRARKQGGMEMQ